VQIRTYGTTVTIGKSAAWISGTNRYYDGVSDAHCKSLSYPHERVDDSPIKSHPDAAIKVQSVERESNLIKIASRALMMRPLEGAFSAATRNRNSQLEPLPTLCAALTSCDLFPG